MQKWLRSKLKMAKRKQKCDKKYYMDEKGFTYVLHRDVFDYCDHIVIDGIVNSFFLEELVSLKKEKNIEAYKDTIKNILSEVEHIDLKYFEKYTKRVQILAKKIYKKEEHIVKILKNSTLETAVTDIRKIKALLKGVKELSYKLSSKYTGDDNA